QVAEIGCVRAAEIEILESLRTAAGPCPGARGIASEPPAERHLRVALFVDLAAVVSRALVLVRQQVIGRRHLGEPLGRVGLVLVAVGVKLLGEAAIGLLDLRLASAAFQPQSLVEVECHSSPMPYRFRADQMGCRSGAPKPKAKAPWQAIRSDCST